MNTPTLKKNRIQQMDVIRGFALFGVLLVNMTMIDATMFSYSSSYLDSLGILNQFSAWMIHVFASGKFYTLFSMLFGLGFYFFMNKSDGTIVENKFFKRRLLALLFFGILHLIFVWYGDILHVYAITGALLLANKNKSPKQLLRTAAILFILSTAIFMLASGANSDVQDFNPVVDEAIAAYTQQSYFEMISYRLSYEIPNVLMNLIFVIPKILALFLLGYYVGKKEIFKNLDANRTLIHQVWVWGLVISVICGFGYTVSEYGMLGGSGPYLSVLFDEVLTLSGALFYATSLIKIYEKKWGAWLLTPLKHSGQMALTNYLTQTIFFTTLIYGYGFGWFGNIPQWAFFPIAVSFYAIQCAFSMWFMKRYTFGPVEKIWRGITYWKSH